MSLFTLIPNIVGGFRDQFLNVLHTDSFGANSRSLGLSELHMEALKKKGEQEMATSEQELERIRDFFDQEIRGREASKVVEVYRLLLKDIPHS